MPAQRDWHGSGVSGGVLIAVPSCQGRVSPVLDVAARLVLVSLHGRVETRRREIVLFEPQTEGMVRSLKECGVQIVICGAISHGLLVALRHAKIRVVGQVCGNVDAVIAAFRNGTLAQPDFAMPGANRPGQSNNSHDHDEHQNSHSR